MERLDCFVQDSYPLLLKYHQMIGRLELLKVIELFQEAITVLTSCLGTIITHLAKQFIYLGLTRLSVASFHYYKLEIIELVSLKQHLL